MTGVIGDAGIESGSRAATVSGDWGIRGWGSLLERPGDVGTGVVAGSFWSSPISFGLPVMNTGGGGRPSQQRPQRNYLLEIRLNPVDAFHWVEHAYLNQFNFHQIVTVMAGLQGILVVRIGILVILEKLEQRSTTDGFVYASNVAPASLNRIMSVSAW